MEAVKGIASRQLNETQEISERASSTSATYRGAVGRLIIKIRLVCSLPAFDRIELAAAIEAFCEVLAGVVPEERLNDAYLYAIRHRDSTYPLAVTEIVEAWRRILTDEIAARRAPCVLCGGQGFAMVYDKKTDTEFKKECPTCFGKVQTAIAKA
jgi:hypothetical protein